MSIPYADARRAGDRVVVPKCPHCGKEHAHVYAQSTGVRQAACGRGPYRILLSLGNAGASAASDTAPETPAAKRGKARVRGR